MELGGCGTALVTPFGLEGRLDEAALRELVKTQIEGGIELLVACGTTGEAATLDDEEWRRTIEVTCAAAAGRVPVFAGCTSNSTAAARARVLQLERIEGLTGVLTANPYYNRPGQEGQYQHFRQIAESTSLAVMLYNIPGRTGANLEPATVLRLAEIENVVGIKESSGNMVQMTELLTSAQVSARRSFKVFAGDDALALPVLALGGAGLISVTANVIPEPMSTLVRAALGNDWETARRINRQFFRLMQAMFVEPSPGPVKAMLAILGKGEDVLRLPMTPVTRALRMRLETMAGELGLLVHRGPSGDDLRMF